MTKWLDKIIPSSRPKFYDPRIITWALFGNDEVGIYGERSETWHKEHPELSFKTWFLWWKRNPSCNLFTYVLNWPHKQQRVLFSWGAKGEREGWKFWYLRPAGIWQEPTDVPFNQITYSVWPPDVDFRAKWVEGYFGWHGFNGKFGIAFRPCGAKPK